MVRHRQGCGAAARGTRAGHVMVPNGRPGGMFVLLRALHIAGLLQSGRMVSRCIQVVGAGQRPVARASAAQGRPRDATGACTSSRDSMATSPRPTRHTTFPRLVGRRLVRRRAPVKRGRPGRPMAWSRGEAALYPTIEAAGDKPPPYVCETLHGGGASRKLMPSRSWSPPYVCETLHGGGGHVARAATAPEPASAGQGRPAGWRVAGRGTGRRRAMSMRARAPLPLSLRVRGRKPARERALVHAPACPWSPPGLGSLPYGSGRVLGAGSAARPGMPSMHLYANGEARSPAGAACPSSSSAVNWTLGVLAGSASPLGTTGSLAPPLDRLG